MTRSQKIAAILIVTLAILVRFVGINHVPPQLGNDEISIAWDAYSILHTLRDEHNHYLPLAFESHGTYKAPLTIYLATIPTWIFGNQDVSARLPSMTLGVLTVMVLGLLVYELTRNTQLALLSALMLTISPAHIIVSRAALETNVGLFFVVLGIYLFYKRSPILAAISFALSVYSYHTEWIFTPLLVLTLGLLNLRSIIKKPIYYLAAFIFLIVIFPLFRNALSSSGPTARQNTEIITHAPRVKEALASPNFAFWQKDQIVLKAVVGSYSSYVEPKYLFFDGYKLLSEDDPYTVGLFLSPFVLCFIVGLWQAKSIFKSHALFLYIWAALAPLVPAITIGDHNNYRNLVSVAPYAILIAVGLVYIWNLCKKIPFGRLIPLGAISLAFFYFLVIYFYHLPYESGESYQAGYKQVAQYISQHTSEYERIVIDPRFGDYNKYDGVPHLYIPYYTSMNPAKMLSRTEGPEGLFFDKYEFRSINWGLEKVDANKLYVVPAANPPATDSPLRTLKEIKLPNGKIVFRLLSVKIPQ